MGLRCGLEGTPRVRGDLEACRWHRLQVSSAQAVCRKKALIQERRLKRCGWMLTSCKKIQPYMTQQGRHSWLNPGSLQLLVTARKLLPFEKLPTASDSMILSVGPYILNKAAHRVCGSSVPFVPWLPFDSASTVNGFATLRIEKSSSME